LPPSPIPGYRVVPIEGAKMAFTFANCIQNQLAQGENLPAGLVLDVIPVTEMAVPLYTWDFYYDGIHFYAVRTHGETPVDYDSFLLPETCLLGLEPL
jgi:hypothetical protein